MYKRIKLTSENESNVIDSLDKMLSTPKQCDHARSAAHLRPAVYCTNPPQCLCIRFKVLTPYNLTERYLHRVLPFRQKHFGNTIGELVTNLFLHEVGTGCFGRFSILTRMHEPCARSHIYSNGYKFWTCQRAGTRRDVAAAPARDNRGEVPHSPDKSQGHAPGELCTKSAHCILDRVRREFSRRVLMPFYRLPGRNFYASLATSSASPMEDI